jgi:hypothetical protein
VLDHRIVRENVYTNHANCSFLPLWDLKFSLPSYIDLSATFSPPIAFRIRNLRLKVIERERDTCVDTAKPFKAQCGPDFRKIRITQLTCKRYINQGKNEAKIR